MCLVFFTGALLGINWHSGHGVPINQNSDRCKESRSPIRSSYYSYCSYYVAHELRCICQHEVTRVKSVFFTIGSVRGFSSRKIKETQDAAEKRDSVSLALLHSGRYVGLYTTSPPMAKNVSFALEKLFFYAFDVGSCVQWRPCSTSALTSSSSEIQRLA